MPCPSLHNIIRGLAPHAEILNRNGSVPTRIDPEPPQWPPIITRGSFISVYIYCKLCSRSGMNRVGHTHPPLTQLDPGICPVLTMTCTDAMPLPTGPLPSSPHHVYGACLLYPPGHIHGTHRFVLVAIAWDCILCCTVPCIPARWTPKGHLASLWTRLAALLAYTLNIYHTRDVNLSLPHLHGSLPLADL